MSSYKNFRFNGIGQAVMNNLKGEKYKAFAIEFNKYLSIASNEKEL